MGTTLRLNKQQSENNVVLTIDNIDVHSVYLSKITYLYEHIEYEHMMLDISYL